MKQCTKCGEVKSLDNYSKTSNIKPSLRGDCKTCEREYVAIHYRENKEQHLANQRLRRKRKKL